MCRIGSIIENNRFIPILLTTADVTITNYGTYSNYIPSGFYICKMLEYIHQCSLKENQYTRCSEEYTYIGNRYQRLFPFKLYSGPKPPTDDDVGRILHFSYNSVLMKIIEAHHPAKIISGGGYYKKYLKYKTKYLQLKQ